MNLNKEEKERTRRRVNFGGEDIEHHEGNCVKCVLTKSSGYRLNAGILKTDHVYDIRFVMPFASDQPPVFESDTDFLKVKSCHLRDDGCGFDVVFTLTCTEVGQLETALTVNKQTLRVKYHVMGAETGTPLLKSGVSLVERLTTSSDEDDSGGDGDS